MKFFHQNREEKLIELYQLCEIGYCKFKWKHSKKCSFLCFGSDLTQVIGEAEKQNGALMHFVRFCFQLPGIWHLLRTFSSRFAKLSNLLPIDWETGKSCGLQFLREHLWFTATGRRAHSLKRGKDYFWRQISFYAWFFFFRFATFSPFWKRGGGPLLSNICKKKRFPTSYLAIKHDWNVLTEKKTYKTILVSNFSFLLFLAGSPLWAEIEVILTNSAPPPPHTR